MPRTPWLDENTALPLLEEKVHALASFTSAMADGRIDRPEVDAQQERLVAAMRAVEDELTDDQHAKVTTLLVELVAYDIMQTLHQLQAERLRTVFGDR